MKNKNMGIVPKKPYWSSYT